MQPIVSAGESSAVTITGKVRRRTLWRFVGSYGAADGIGPYSRVCSLFCSSFSWFSALFELFCSVLPPIRAQSNIETVPVEAGVMDGTGACVCCLQFFRCDSTCFGFVKEKGASSICSAFFSKNA
jgi:hypothetical protein